MSTETGSQPDSHSDTLAAYDPQGIETRWQQAWSDQGTFAARDDLPREECYYVLEMFPYPSGKLHMGHVRNYSIGDAVARYQRLRGKHVLHPMGWDSFGLPAEQAAIDRGLHPKSWTYDNIAHMRGQLQRLGFSYDWSREFATSDEDYSAHEQRLFLDLVEQGLVYRKTSVVNWSTGLNTVLANEQVVDGLCWRTGMPVIQKELPQWFLRTTAFAEELDDELANLTGWPESVRTMQRNWIGKSHGAEIDFAIAPGSANSRGPDSDQRITVFTTRPDTVFGVTFMSVAPEHPLVDAIVSDEQRGAIEAFRGELRNQSSEDRTGENAEKKGVFTGAYAVNPVNGDEVPVYAANFVLADYGTGAVMAVPAHDTRDFAFAKAYGLPIKRVILAPGEAADAPMEAAYTDIGTMVDSGKFDGQQSDAAKTAITQWLEQEGAGRGVVSWRLRDWGLSRQRYWGNPIPYVYGEEQGAVPLRPQDLPVRLPEDVTFDGVGNPLEKHQTWATTDAEGCQLTVATATGKEPARRETDTMDTFVQSSWYFARYTCADAEEPLDSRRVDHWLPVDLYVGGIEHACMHLLYARFFQKALCESGLTTVREPFKRLLCQGMVVAETYFRLDAQGKKVWFNPAEVEVDRDSKGAIVGARLQSDGQPVEVGRIEKMSKSKNNGVDPQEIVDEYGADTARLFILSDVPPEKDLMWDDAGVAGAHRFIKRLWQLIVSTCPRLEGVAAHSGKGADCTSDSDKALVRQMHAAVKRATEALDQDFGFNVSIAECRKLFNAVEPDRQDPAVMRRALETLVTILAPITPHVCSELWRRMGHEEALEDAGWPAYDEAELVADTIQYPLQVKGKVRGRIELPAGLTGSELEEAVLAHPQVQEVIGDQTVRKLIAVPGKIVNLVI